MLAKIATTFKRTPYDSYVAKEVLKREGTPAAIEFFDACQRKLSHYSYWFMLGTFWVSHSAGTDIAVWKRLFSSPRPGRELSLMKSDELEALRLLPDTFFVFRAHRPRETDWISYTLNPVEAAAFAARYGVREIRSYQAHKKDVLALFLRRGEQEILLLDKAKAALHVTLEIGLDGSVQVKEEAA